MVLMSDLEKIKKIWDELLCFVASRLGSEEMEEVYQIMKFYDEEFKNETRTKE
jgi:hypothetical protein